MKLNSFVVGIIFIGSFQVILGQNEYLSCEYEFFESEYTCFLNINNPNGSNNFQKINGTHLDGRNDSDVLRIYRYLGSTANVPSIICNKFRNLQLVDFSHSNIKRIGEDSFKGCVKLNYLRLRDNRITEIHEESFSENSELLTLILWSNEITTWPENVFINLHKLTHLDMDSNGIKTLPNNIFKSLKMLQTLDLRSNRFSTIKKEWLETLERLEILYLHSNQIEQLPENVFSPLKNLIYIFLNNNKLKVLDSNSFSLHPNLTQILAYSNEITAIDERIIDNTNVTWFDMRFNLCANTDIFDNSPSRSIMRANLSVCFENFRNLTGETTTVMQTTTLPTTTIFQTLPPDCDVGNLDERVCRVEYENSKLKHDNLRLGEEIDTLNAVIEELQDNIKEQNKIFAKALDDLQDQILELINNPCGCR